MAKPPKRSRDDDDDDRDDDRPAKKKSKKEAKGGNTMLFVLLGGGLVVGLCCVCGGGGSAIGYYQGWFGGSEKKTTVAKGGDKNKEGDKGKDQENVDPNAGKGTGPLVTMDNFVKATKRGYSVAEVEKIMGPGLPVKGAENEKLMALPTYRTMRQIMPDLDVYKWSNETDYFYIFFKEGKLHANGGDDNPNRGKGTGKDKVGPGPGAGTGPKVNAKNFNKLANGTSLAEAEQIMGPGLKLMGAELNATTAQFKTLKQLRSFLPNADVYQWNNGKEYYFVLISQGAVNGKMGPSLKGRD